MLPRALHEQPEPAADVEKSAAPGLLVRDFRDVFREHLFVAFSMLLDMLDTHKVVDVFVGLATGPLADINERTVEASGYGKVVFGQEKLLAVRTA
jgi:hypothetical protein